MHKEMPEAMAEAMAEIMPERMQKTLQDAIIDWFRTHQRDLPWRRGYHPYEVWISEIMLQQTQMERGIEYFGRWLLEFPDIESLARADEGRVLKLWEGLGYYSRARNLQRCARILLQEHQGVIPDDPVILRSLPGIGPYTAGAIASIAYNRDAPLVDGNVARLFARLFTIDLRLTDPACKKEMWRLAADILPQGRARLFNQGLMEIGALICTPKNPSCKHCPLTSHCLAHRHGLSNLLPIPTKGPKIIPIEMATGLLWHQGRIFIQQRRASDVWGGLWEFPGGGREEDEQPAQTVAREFMEETGLTVTVGAKITTVTHHYTRYRVTLHGFACTLVGESATPILSAAQDCGWVCLQALDDYAFPAGHRQLIEFIKQQS